MRSLKTEGQPCRALVVDDNSVNRLVLDTMLSQAGCIVEQATDGHEAYEAVSERPFDVVVIDVAMPKMDGLMATRVIRALEAERSLARTPIIVISGFVSSPDVRASLAAGADLHLGKPVQKEALLAALNEVLNGISAAKPPQFAHYFG